jgi:hypothetical protein
MAILGRQLIVWAGPKEKDEDEYEGEYEGEYEDEDE